MLADGRPLGMTVIEAPCRVVLHLPSTRTVEVQSTSTTLQQERGFVTVVAILPLKRLVSFGGAVEEAEKLARECKVKDGKVYETMSKWRQAGPNCDPFGPKYLTRATVEPTVDVNIRVRPHPTQDGWFVAVEFDGEVPADTPVN